MRPPGRTKGEDRKAQPEGAPARPFEDARVQQHFAACPLAVRRDLLKLREMIFEVAAETPGVGEIEETLKWGQPAYVTAQSGSGSTLRIDARKGAADAYAMFFHCQTDLVQTFRTTFAGDFDFEGNRALRFKAGEPVANDALRLCVRAALTYHLRKPLRPRSRSAAS